MTDVNRDGPPRALLIAAILVGAAAVIGVLAVAVIRQAAPQRQPIAISSVPAPQAESPACKSLLAALPEQLGDYRRAPLADPAASGAAAWQAGPDREPVILRCGLDRPADFVVGSPLQAVDDVQWFQVGDPAAEGRSTWFTVDRAAYVALTLPNGSGPTPIQQLSEVIAETMATRPLDPAAAR
jgi:hypothetical protein